MRRFLPGGLARHRDFRNLWAAETVSQLGSQVSQIALPLVAIIVLNASAFEVALLGVIEFAPFILISLPAGVWVDRLRRKPILVAADVGRALLLASIPVAHWLGVLTIWQLYVVGFAVGFLTVFFDVSYQSYLPSLVPREQLIEGNSKLEISRSAAQLAGPRAGGRARRGADRAGRRARGCDQLPRLGDLPLPDPQGGDGADTRRAPGRAGDEGRGRRGPALGVRQPLPALDRGLDRDVQLLRQHHLRGLPRLRRARAGPAPGRDRTRLRRLERRLPRRRAAREPDLAPIRRRPGDHHRGARLDLSPPARARAEVEPDPVSDRCAGDLEHGRPDLQHHPGQLPAGDHAGDGSRGG